MASNHLPGLPTSLFLLLVPGLAASCSTAADPSSRVRCRDDTECDGSLTCRDGACVDGADSSGTGPGSGGAGAASTSGAGAQAVACGETNDPAAPKLLSFGTNVTTLHEGQTVTFSAVLTDSQGVDDVIGGTLKSETGASYAVFATSAEEGAYEATLTWEAINQVAPIDFDYGGDTARTFVAEFFDVDGHVTKGCATLTLGCTQGWAACGGTCTDVLTDTNHCGTCTETPACLDGCANGWCGRLCLADWRSKGTTCTEICASLGGTCSDYPTCNAGAVHYVVDDCDPLRGEETVDCDQPIAPETAAVACCCSK